tara:strand:- start:75397 stop:75624 length:228 start_codon:yes stop_codon:yes gene_type:complete
MIEDEDDLILITILATSVELEFSVKFIMEWEMKNIRDLGDTIFIDPCGFFSMKKEDYDRIQILKRDKTIDKIINI